MILTRKFFNRMDVMVGMIVGQ